MGVAKKPKMRDGVVKRGHTWYFVVGVPDLATGKKKQTWFRGGDTQQAAKDARIEKLNQISNRTFVAPVKVSVGQYLDGWLKSRRSALKPKSYNNYRDCVDYYLKPTLGDFQLQTLNPLLISQSYTQLIESGGGKSNGKGVSPRTVESVHAVLRTALNDAVANRLIPENPALSKALHTPAGSRSESEIRVMTKAQLKAVLSAVADHRLKALFELAARTGMRRGECVALRWSDIDFAAATIHVRRNAGTVKNENYDGSGLRNRRIEGNPKSGRSRVIPISKKLVAILREHKAKQSAERLRIGSLWRGSDDSVFTTEFGAQIHPDTPTGLFTRLRPLLGQLPKDQRPTFHSFRHTHATTLLLSGTPPHVVAHRLGHRDANVTLAIYAHLLPGYDVQAAELFDAEMDKPVEGEATDEDQISKSS